MSNETCRLITKEQYQEYMELKKQFADASKKVKRWKPVKGQDYYIIGIDLGIYNILWNNDAIDNGHFKVGNCFRTKEEAQKELDRRFAEQELLSFCDNGDDKSYFIIFYNPLYDFFSYSQKNETVTSPYRFSSIDSVEKAIDTLGTDKLKLIFRIED